MKFIFATGNKGKLAEARQILGDGYEILSPSELGIDADVEETGSSFQENSEIKADYIHSEAGIDCFADDSGMVVYCLDGRPGIYSARYAGESKNFDDNIFKVLGEVKEYEATHEPDRRAAFVCVVTLVLGGEKHFFEGRLEGHLIFEKKGDGGFGYDPIFVPEGYDQTLSEMTDEQKNALSHRGIALRKMAQFIKTL